MDLKISLKWSAVIAGGVVYYAAIIYFLTFGLLGQVSYAKTLLSTKSAGPVESALGEPSSGFPVRLKIPAINVNAAIERVGLTPQGAVAVPKGPTNAAWFYLGPRPGEKGSSVIDGHFGWKNGIPAVFDDLNKLRKGDKLYVEDEKGAVVSFIVREIRTYAHDKNVPGVFDSNDGKAHLNLITCEGVWNEVQKNYSDRLVVFTDKEMEQ